ncbi:hypothetical protein AFLA_012053 [Aspergillus flavus NRRL3357]|nr:hypothetical protein AFLA_012053 [Aspergillus flavus NRRL3357]
MEIYPRVRQAVSIPSTFPLFSSFLLQLFSLLITFSPSIFDVFESSSISLLHHYDANALTQTFSFTLICCIYKGLLIIFLAFQSERRKVTGFFSLYSSSYRGSLVIYLYFLPLTTP